MCECGPLSLQIPGQHIEVQFDPRGLRCHEKASWQKDDEWLQCRTSLVLANSPTSVCASSMGLDASIVELIVDAAGEDDAAATLSSGTPGMRLYVGPIEGRGYV